MKTEFTSLDIFAPTIRAVLNSYKDVYHISFESGQNMSLNVLNEKNKIVTNYVVSIEDVNYTLGQIAVHNQVDKIEWIDDMTGLKGELTRIVGIFDHKCVTGLAIRLGRSFPEAYILIQDILDRHESVLLMGPAGSRKTTMLRSMAGYIGKTKNITLIDAMISDLTSGGEGFVHPSVRGVSVLRGSIKERGTKALRSIQGLLPDWLAIDEVSHDYDVNLVLTASRKGAAIMATCHGLDLEDFINNGVINKLSGDIDKVILSGSIARERGLNQQSVYERTGLPAFKYLIQMVDVDIIAIYNMAEAVDQYNDWRDPKVEIRSKLGSQWSTMTKLQAEVAGIRERLAEIKQDFMPRPIVRVYAPDLSKKEAEMIRVQYGFISLVDDQNIADVAIYSSARYARYIGQRIEIPVFIKTGKIADLLAKI